MNYKVLSSCHPKTKLTDQKRLFCESVMLQLKLKKAKFELIFIDEFHLSSRKAKFRGWGFIDKKNKIITPIEGFSMYFIIAISENHFYGIMASDSANTSEIFIHFLSKLLNSIQSSNSNEDRDLCFVIDNASIHKTSDAK